MDWDPGLDFAKHKKDLSKKYRHIEGDIQAALALIQANHLTACHATPLQGYSGSVWKYRIGNSDSKKGRSGGYRLLVHFNETTRKMTPLAIYTKDEYPGQPSNAQIDRWLKGALEKAVSG
jgi:mRNA-degrading endonuclease RelE of RelBE toxin-antitoxin system